VSTPSGLGLKLRINAARLTERHGGVPAGAASLPLFDPVPGPVCVRGVAAATSVDSQRTAFSPGCFGFRFDLKAIAVLYRHDVARIVGTLDELTYSPKGDLIAQATIDDPDAARCPAFSVGATIIRYELVDDHLPIAHARVLEARLDEVATTPAPANGDARVLERWPAEPGRFSTLM
jgi:hypothetical protein